MSFRQNAPRRDPHDTVLEKGDALFKNEDYPCQADGGECAGDA